MGPLYEGHFGALEALLRFWAKQGPKPVVEVNRADRVKVITVASDFPVDHRGLHGGDRRNWDGLFGFSKAQDGGFQNQGGVLLARRLQDDAVDSHILFLYGQTEPTPTIGVGLSQLNGTVLGPKGPHLEAPSGGVQPGDVHSPLQGDGFLSGKKRRRMGEEKNPQGGCE